MAATLITELIARQAALQPDALAAESGGRRMTYRELNGRANRLARLLQARGVGPGVAVGVCLQRSPELLVGFLAAMKAGGAYVPMDPAYPQERLSAILADAGAPVLLTQASLKPGFEGTAPAIICLDTEWADVAEESDEELPVIASAADLAYIIYTSGSTGKPKGVEVSHGALLNLVHWFRRTYALTPLDRVTYLAGIGFDASVSEIWPCLASGGSLHLPDDETRLVPEKLRDWLVARRLTVAFAPTPMMEALLGLTWPAETALRILYAGGEKLRRYPSPDHPFRVIDNYGPTETACIATYAVIPPTPDEAAPPHIGVAIDNTEVWLLDEQLQPVPPGEVGEICIGGQSLARGYRNLPELTAAKFIAHPFSDQPGARLYRTGDLGRMRPDGNLTFVGRVDHQVKIRGFRIELGEIEAVLAQHPGVREAAVLAREDAGGERRLVAYVAGDSAAAELRRSLFAKLPDYMIPTLFVGMDRLPVTASGKVDRQALPAPDWSRASGDQGFVAPRTRTEESLCAIWAQVLGLPQIGIHDDFFALGGHSLRATQITVRIREQLGVELPLSTLFANPTVAQLAGAVEGLGQARAGGIPRAPRDGHLPLSCSQEPVWFLQKLSPGLAAYNFQATIRLTGRLEIAVLEQALSEIVRRHEIFRTTFVEVDGRPVQRIHEPWAVRIPVEELIHLPEAEREGAAEQRTRELIQTGFDLSQLPLIHWTLLRLSPSEHLLVQVEHHFAHDGWSFAVFLKELKALYTAFLKGEESPLPALPIQYADYALFQRRWLEGPEAAAQLAYWQQKLAGAPPVLELPADRPRPPVQSFQGDAIRVKLPPRLADRVRALGKAEGATLFMTLLATFHTLLLRYTGQTDLCTGAGVANRRWQELEPLIGMIINTVPLRTDLSGNPTFRELLARVRATAVEAFANADVPFDRIVDAVQPERSLSYLPVYQVAFSFHNAPMTDLSLPGLELRLHEGHNNGSAKFDLNVITIPRLEMGTASDEVVMVWEWNADIFEQATIERMINHYRRLLEAVTEGPDRRLADLPLLDQPEFDQVVTGWNQTDAPYALRPLVHELVAGRAAREPYAPAVVMGTERLTYAELDRGANQVAHWLQRQGAGPEAVVAVCLERSPLMILAQLAVLKAGAAYLPLDPRNPAEHLRFTLADSGAIVLLTQESLAAAMPFDGAVLRLDADWRQMADQPETAPESAVQPENLAYVIYTSGSTGRPKGVMVEHRSLLNLVHWHQHAFRITCADRATQVAGPAFDAAVWELWPYLTAGASIHIASEETRTAPEQLRDWLAAERITAAFLPTPLAEAVLALPWPEQAALRVLLTGGDQLRVRPRPDAPFTLYNNYGPTENTVVATCGQVTPGAGLPPIGRPIANVRAYVLDAQLRPCPIGVPGELCLGGASLARGYLNRPELTAERFVQSQLDPEQRLYRTGDLVRLLPDGQIEFLGRIDSQVKVRGFRIELGEIEAVLAQHPDVREAAVTAREEHGQKRLVAYVAPAGVPAEALRTWLQARLPEYMVPTAFVGLEALPLTANGKLDRRSLPAPEAGGEEIAWVAPRTPVEERLAAIWAEVLSKEPISVTADFFDLGGHSLMTTRVIARIRDAFGIDLPIRALFEAPTIEALADLLLLRQLESLTDEELERLL